MGFFWGRRDWRFGIRKWLHKLLDGVHGAGRAGRSWAGWIHGVGFGQVLCGAMRVVGIGGVATE